jgi:DNA-binding NarL/FixJ family response regulator
MKKLSILLVDDNAFIRDAIKVNLCIGKQENSIHEATNGKEAVQLVSKNDYDVILMDISMPIMNGIEASTEILKLKPKSKIIAVSMHSTKDEIDLLKEMGVKGYVLKEDVSKDLQDVIVRTLKGEAVFDLNYY